MSQDSRPGLFSSSAMEHTELARQRYRVLRASSKFPFSGLLKAALPKDTPPSLSPRAIQTVDSRSSLPETPHTMSELLHIKTTLGAILLGCMLSTALSGMTIVQTFLYFRLYPKDPARIKFMVIGVLLLDTTHAALMCASTWDYLVLNFGNEEIADRIPITIGLTVALTATITFLTQLFFSHRVFRLSRGNWFITAPLVMLSCVRLGAALVSTTEMGKLRSYHLFVENFGYVFTLGLSTACTVDIGITVAMCYFLQTSRTGFGEMDHIIDTIMLYTFNTGALTCVTTVVSMICWLTMPRNLIFLGLHFAISKLYANSLLATLNGRRSLRKRKMGPIGASHALPVLFSCDTCARSRARFQSSLSPTSEMDPSRLEISIEKTIRCDVDEEDPRGDRPGADQTG